MVSSLGHEIRLWIRAVLSWDSEAFDLPPIVRCSASMLEWFSRLIGHRGQDEVIRGDKLVRELLVAFRTRDSSRLARLWEDVRPDALLRIDSCLRLSNSKFVDGWYEFSSADVARIAREPHAWALLGLAVSHYNGYVRHAAVERLGSLGDGRAIQFLLLRLNDWVDGVRRSARTALERYLSPNYAREWVACLVSVFALESQHRTDHADFVKSVSSLLRAPECRQALHGGCHVGQRRSRLVCLRLAAGAEGVDAAGIFRSSLSDPDPAVRLWAVRTFAARKNLIDRQHLGEAALRDRSVQVRREAAPLLLDTLDADAAVAYLREMLLDENVGARWQARGLMTSRKALDFRVFYQDAVRRADRASRLRGALLGLGESGRREDVGMVMPFVERPPVRVQRAAIRALGSLAGAEHVQLFLQLLRSPLPGISKEARLVLQSNIEKVPANDLRQAITEETLASRSRCQALSLASHMGKWTAVLLLLEGHRTSDIDIQKRARLLLRSWRSSYNKSFAVPRLKEVEQLASVLADIAGRLHPDESRDLEHILQSAHRIADP